MASKEVERESPMWASSSQGNVARRNARLAAEPHVVNTCAQRTTAVYKRLPMPPLSQGKVDLRNARLAAEPHIVNTCREPTSCLLSAYHHVCCPTFG